MRQVVVFHRAGTDARRGVDRRFAGAVQAHGVVKDRRIRQGCDCQQGNGEQSDFQSSLAFKGFHMVCAFKRRVMSSLRTGGAGASNGVSRFIWTKMNEPYKRFPTKSSFFNFFSTEQIC